MRTIKGCLLGLCVVLSLGVYAEGPCYVDVLFAIDAKASAYLQDEKGLTVDQYAANQLAGMNAVLTNSGLNTSFLFRSVGAYELGFEAKLVDSSKQLTRDVLENATGGKGMWEDLHTERDNRGADVVSLIIDTGSEYGHVGDGNALTNLSAAASFGENAYSVVGVRSTFAYYAVLHEIGHNLGAGHALETSSADQSTAYSHGYNFAVGGQGYYTVMGYPNNSAVPPTQAIPYFSTPDKTYLGAAVGTAARQDNVRVLKQTCQAASQWRTLPAKAHPQMSVAWNQSSPMNDFAAVAYKNGSWAKAPCGCPATAAAQMLKHYAWPVRTDEVFEGVTQRFRDDTPEAFPIRFDGHNDFLWAKMQNRASDNDVVGNYETARLTMWCGAMALTDYRVGDSSADFENIAESASPWFKKGRSTYYVSDGADATFKALTNALDRGEMVQVMLKGHQVVADAYRFNEGNLEVHLNYGHAGSDTKWYTKAQLEDEYAGIINVWTGFTPKKMAQLKPLPKQVASTEKIPLNWAVPQKYADDLAGFMIMAYYPSDTLQKTFTGGTGTMAADRAGTYNLTGAFGLTGDSKLSYTLSSYHTSGIKVELQARFDAGEWQTVSTPALSTTEDVYDKGTLVSTGWLETDETVDLASYANKTAEFRFKVTRTAKTRTKDGQLFFAAPIWTQVYSPTSNPLGLSGYPSLRACNVSAAGYAGKVVSFTIEPIMADSVVSEPVATKVVATSVPAQPAVVSVAGVTDGFRRICAVGKNEFIVNVNETTTKVTASSSHLALVGDDDILLVTDLGNNTWSVAIDATDVPENSQLILTLCAEDALGNKSYKDLQLTFAADTNAMYYNTLNAGDEDVKVARGTYGAIEVPAVGYYATAFDELTTLAKTADNTYAGIIKNGTYLDTHTVAGWFNVGELPTGSDLKTVYLAKSHDGDHGGYKVAVDADGKLLIGKIDYNGGAYSWHESNYKITDDALVQPNTWFHLAIAITKSEDARTVTPSVFVNGQTVAVASGTFEGNLNGNSCTDFMMGADMTAAGLYVDTRAIADAATVVSFATNACYVAKGSEVMPEPEPTLPILIDTGYDTSTTNGGVEVTVVMEVANVAPTNLQALLTLNVGSRTNAVGMAVDDEYNLSGIAEGSYPWSKWKNFANYPSDGKIHRIAFGYAGTASNVTGSGGYRGTKIVIDGTNVYTSGGLVYASLVVKRMALGGGFDKPERTLAGAKILSYEIYPAALGETELKKLTKPASVDYTADVVAEEVVWSNGDGAGLANHGKWVNSTISTITLTNKMSSARIRFDSEVVAAKLSAVQQSGCVLALSADAVPVIGQYDMSGNAGELVLGYPLDSALDVSAATVVGGTDATLAFELGEDVEQSISGTTTVAARLYTLKVLSGVLTFTATGGSTSFRGRTVVADGSNAVVRLAAGDATGYTNPGTKIRLANGGALEVGQRDTLCTPVELDGGIVMLLAGCANGKRGLDLFNGDGNNWTVAGESRLAVAAGASANDRKVHLRDGDWNINVAEDGIFMVDATVVSDAGGSGTRGNIVKTGAGILRLTAANTFATELRVEEGKLELLQPTLGGSLVMAAGTTIDIAHEGKIADGTVLLTAGSIDIGNATLLVNGKQAPEFHVAGGKLKVGKPPLTTLLNPYAVTEGGVIKVSCNAEAVQEQAAKAYDGDASTYFDPGDTANSNGVSWTGVEFTNGVIVTEIAFSSAMKRRMIGGAFQGANLADYSDATNICVVESYSGGTETVELPEAKGPYKYLRFIGMYGGNASEIAYYGLADSGAVAPVNAPTIESSWSTDGVAGLKLVADTTIPQVYIVQRAMADFCEDDDYETFVTLVPQSGNSATWNDYKATGYAKYRTRGFNANGSSDWTYFDIEPEKLIVDGPDKPAFGNALPGFYASETNVTISYKYDGAKIYYTTDGSTPTTNSTLYTGAIPLVDVCGKTNALSYIRTNPKEITGNDYAWKAPKGEQPNVNVIRARAFLPDGSASKFDVAGTWMVGETANQHQLRVVSLQTDVENYFSDATGIQVPGDIYKKKGFGSHPVGMPNANYFQSGDDWERPTQIEIFETDRTKMLSAQIGTRVRGFWSRAAAKKSLTCYFRKEYGTKNAKIALFGDEGKKKFKRFLLRNGGNDWYKFGYRDAIGQSLFRRFVETGTQGLEPSVLYVNGEYWGLYNLRHCYSKHHFEEWNDSEGDDIDYVKLTPESGEHFELQEGDFNAMWDIMQYMISCTEEDGVMSDEEYARVEEEVDIADMIDYHIMNIFLGNNDWLSNGNNMGYWRNRSGKDRRWHFTVYDCDSAMSFNGDSYKADHIAAALNVNDTNDGATKMAPGFFKRCFKNAGFRRRFANRYADLLNTALTAERATNIVAQITDKVRHEVPRNVSRWTNIGSESNWESEFATVNKFFYKRQGYAFTNILNHCDGGALANITLAACEGKGKVKINTIESGRHFELPFTSQYFTNIPVTLVAEPESGSAFEGWKIDGETISTDTTIELMPNDGVTIQAVFSQAAGNPQQALRLVEIYGSTNKEIDPEKNTDEYVVITNTSDQAVSLAGLKLTSAKVGKSPSLNIALEEGMVPAHGSCKLEQDDWTAAGWEKITNGEIIMTMTDSDGVEIQVCNTEFKGDANGKGASLIAQNLCNPCDDWVAGPIHDVPPRPTEDIVLTGYYPEGTNITLTADTAIVVSNVTFDAVLNLTGAFTTTLRLPEGSYNILPKIKAEGALVIEGDGEVLGVLSLDGCDKLITCGGLTVNGGVLALYYSDGAAETCAVDLTGSYIQNGGIVRIELRAANEVYGFYMNKKSIEVKILGGEFNAVVDAGAKSATFKLLKGSNDATLGGGNIDVKLYGDGPRFIQTKGKIKLAGATIAVEGGDATNARVFKSAEKVDVSDGTIDGDAAGEGSEVFSSDDEIVVSGGTVCVTSSDDCFSAQTNIVVSGGIIYGHSISNDVFDSNGRMTVSGGTILAYALAEGHAGFDTEPKEPDGLDHTFTVSGGTVVALGGAGSAWPTNCVFVQSVFTNTACAAEDWSWKYLVVKGATELADVTTTALLPEISDTFIMLVTTPGLTGAPTASTSAPICDPIAKDVPAWVAIKSKTFQEYLRFIDIYGSTTGKKGDLGEWFVLTNICDKTVTLAGLKIEITKNEEGAASKCKFTVTNATTVVPFASQKFDQADWTTAGWEKITNGDIHYVLSNDAGTIQQGYLEFCAAADGGGASMVTTNLSTTLTYGDWEPSFKLPATNTTGGAGIDLGTTDPEKAAAKAKGYEVVLTEEDKAAGVPKEALMMAAESVTNEVGEIKGYVAVVAVNPAVVEEPAVGEEGEVKPIVITPAEGGTEVSVGIVNATLGLWYGYEVCNALGDGFANDVPSFNRATDTSVTITGSKRSGNAAFFRVKVLPARPTK